MCGLFGAIGNYDYDQCVNAFDLLSHRGPDFSNIVREEGLFLGHHRLSIVDLNEQAHQPFSMNGVILLFNGEIYNFKEIKSKLKLKCNTESDTEVLLLAYLEYGPKFIELCVGMFAIAIYDNGKLFLFRDRLGKKPLFYTQQNGSFYFASEIKALKPILKNKELNKDALHAYLSFLAPTVPNTFFKGLYKLGPGQVLTFINNKVEAKPYYNMLDHHLTLIETEELALSELKKAFEISLNLRSKSEVSMAGLLSGGMDSAFIAANLKKNGIDIPFYTLGYSEYEKYDERNAAIESAKELNLDHHLVELNQSQFIDNCDNILLQLDEPLNDPAALPLYILMKRIKEDGHKVVLSGEGSDELFLGYRQYFEYLDIEKASQLMHKNWLRKYFKSNFSMNREWEWYKRIFEGSLLFRTSGEKFTDLQKNTLMKEYVQDNDSLEYLKPLRDTFDNSKYNDPQSWYSYVDLMQFQAEHFLCKLDRVSMAHGIEARTPYLDHHFVETVFSIEPNIRLQNYKRKEFFKKLTSPLLSKTILDRKKKGFSNPYMEWLVSSKKINKITQVNQEVGIFKTPVLEKYIERAKSGLFKQHVWGLYCLSLFLEKEFL